MTRPWEPNSAFDWTTGGRELSEEERDHLRRVMIEDKRLEKAAQEQHDAA